ncbi:23S rRNA (adenine(2503)-C(2))-methyltransferase RlmN [Aminirod propionatiphilus]|uniref:23S rRNA (Adenine(2503)-C(2))-methyltransferase RlmN n=1 Tax=Aminirod propionatiphilus TaxID=3415223 RepID=A0ACD1DXU8_9BACT|nr:23S rRNA (adenine(2503)-C(2))-methyltransferase RlmN [Synergistota bacterium]
MGSVIKGLDMDYEELRLVFEERLGEPRFRVDQVGAWVYRRRIFDVSQMTDLSIPLRERLALEIDFTPPRLSRDVTSERDGTKKFLWRLDDGETVESVLLVHDNRQTACLSTQVGCPLSCTFCATGQGGFVRDLSAGEIVGQLLAMEAHLGRDIANVVFMGMGEPLLNVDALLKAIAILNHTKLRAMSIRRFTVSTAGIVPAIRRLAQEAPGVGLSVSLHAPTDGLRSRLMPVDKRYPLGALMAALSDYQERTGNRISFEYLLMADVNDSLSHARDLAALLSGMKAYVNLIPFNAVEGADFKRSSRARVQGFKEELQSLGVEVETRAEKGSDIDAACGQLRRREAGETYQGRPASDRPRSDGPRRDDRPRSDGPRRDDRPRSDAPRRDDRPRSDGPRRDDRPRSDAPRRDDRPRSDAPRRDDRPRYDGPRRDDRPRYDGPRRDDRPRYDGPRRDDRPRSDAPRRDDRPRYDGPRRDDRPRSDAPRRDDRPRSDAPRRDDRPRSDAPRRDDRPRSDAPRRDDRPRSDGPRRDDRPRSDAPRRDDRPRYDGPRRDDRPRSDAPRRDDRPRYDGPRRDDRPRSDGPRRDDRPRYDGPRRDDRPRSDAPRRDDRPRSDAPRRDDRPRSDAPRRDDRPRSDGSRPERAFAFSRFADKKGRGRPRGGSKPPVK